MPYNASGEWKDYGSPTLYAGTVAATTTPQPLEADGEDHECAEVVIQAHPDNTERVLVGNHDAQPIVLLAGMSFALPVARTGLAYVRAEAGTATAGWVARYVVELGHAAPRRRDDGHERRRAVVRG